MCDFGENSFGLGIRRLIRVIWKIWDIFGLGALLANVGGGPARATIWLPEFENFQISVKGLNKLKNMREKELRVFLRFFLRLDEE